jgi:hypothetical protein
VNIHTTPLLISPDNTIERLQRVDFGDNQAYDEQWLQNLIFEHSELLPVFEIDPDFATLVPVCMELQSASGRIDCLYVTTTGRLVIVEVKLFRNPESRREVVGQTLDYAKDINQWDYAQLDNQVRKRTGDISLYECVKSYNAELPESQFIDAVQKSLSNGRFLLLVVGDGVRQGAADIKDFLTRNASMEFTFAMIEMVISRMTNGAFLIQPRVLQKTEIIERHVISVENSIPAVTVKVKEDVVEFEGYSPSEPSEEQNRNLIFWEKFLSSLSLNDKTQPLGNPSKNSVISFSLPPKGSVSWITVFKEKRTNSTGIFIRFKNSDKGIQLFSELEAMKNELDSTFLEKLTWVSDQRIISIEPISFDFSEETSWETTYSYYERNLNALVDNFRPLLLRLSLPR